ncbi:PREDICTED: pleckstrin homology domain-containing family A member 2-like, partial [Tauraco erythrolophus]|uniref:pleckstrin homology domain-containing family A member 2-like n=1 Tax=Tauraco erythrolophus TaxID=121530 RepID=UPI000523C835
VPKGGSVPPTTEITKPPAVPQAQERKAQGAYNIGGVVVHTPINQPTPPAGPPVLKSGYCVKQGNVRKSWKRRFFVLDEFSISYYKCEQDKEPLRSILLRDVCKTHECLVKSGSRMKPGCAGGCLGSKVSLGLVCLQADSPEDMHSWIRVITGAVQALKTRPREISFMRSSSMVRPSSSSGPSQHRQAVEERRALGKAPSTSSWQPWTPPEPQHIKDKPFAFDLDDESIRTTDV